MKSVCKIISHSGRGRAPAAAGHSPKTRGQRGVIYRESRNQFPQLTDEIGDFWNSEFLVKSFY